MFKPGSPLDRLRRSLHWLEDSLLVLVFVGMLGLAVYQVILRNTLGYSLPWIDPLNRVGVLWITLLGAMIAARHDDHIKIDLITHFLPMGLRIWLMRLVALFSSAALGVLGWHSARLVLDERTWSSAQVAGVATWQWQLILPIGFAIMAVRYAGRIIRPRLTASSPPDEASP